MQSKALVTQAGVTLGIPSGDTTDVGAGIVSGTGSNLSADTPGAQSVEIGRVQAVEVNLGRAGTSEVLKLNEGKRYLPYFRGSLNQFAFELSEFRSASTKKRNHYRVCYYDPTLGARSALSNDIIVVCNASQDDRVNGRTVRRLNSVWIE